VKKPNSSRQQINTELAIRGANQRVKKVIEHHTPQEEQDGLKIDFYCECSNANCDQRISLTLDQYDDLHNNQARFIIAKGHSTPAVEQIIKTHPNLQVVEKYVAL
jgi:hypothetical protein